MMIIKFFVHYFKNIFTNIISQFYFYRKTNFIPPVGLIAPNIIGITFGKNFKIGAYSQLFCQDPERGSKISFGDNVAINTGTMINADLGATIVVGNDVLIGPQVIIRGSNHGSKVLHVPINQQPSVPGKIVIGNNVWIGSNSVILPNVTIGDHSIIGAGSIVTKDIPPYSIAVGVPARVIKNRTLETP